MPYNEKLTDRVREYLAANTAVDIQEMKMFRGITCMVNGKMCVGISGDELMIRLNPSAQDEFCELAGFRPMHTKGKTYKGYGYIGAEHVTKDQQLSHWLEIALAFNKKLTSNKAK